ncbi:MAG: ferredoxin family protein [Verrucomicrobiales bacterium]|nr:ferredoxin family protein [Verrucomicrobiales bacterium]
MIHHATVFQVLLYEGTGTVPLQTPQKVSILSALLDRGYSVATVGSGISPNTATLLVLGQFTAGQAPVLEDAAGSTSLHTRDITGLDDASILRLADAARDGRPLNQPGQWKPWFPVIDYSRCTNCMQCLSFCLFDVYGVSSTGGIQVQNNDNCKTNCPACSRVCPEVAIMFPKYSAGPINGEAIRESDVSREKMKVDISALLGGDIYSRLRERSDAAKSRFSKERDSGKALAERRKCLTKLAADGFIPADVLENLPSPEEIQRRAQEAAAKAQAALRLNGTTPA